LRAVLQDAAVAGGMVNFSWIALPDAVYQIQSTTNLSQTNWTNLGSPLTATNPILTGTAALTTNTPQFFRVVFAP
jgi:hypothetical protein